MKNAKATSHGRSRLLEAEGVEGTGADVGAVTGLLAMESKNYFTNESENLLEDARTVATVLSLAWIAFRGPLVRCGRNQLYKDDARGRFVRAFLATI
jgi:hypothetical protein